MSKDVVNPKTASFQYQQVEGTQEPSLKSTPSVLYHLSSSIQRGVHRKLQTVRSRASTM